jgi:hypothetical protein
MFYELFAYRRPFEGVNYGALMRNILTQELKPVSEFAPGIPPDVTAVMGRMLRKDVGQRFQSMEEAVSELEPIWRQLQQAEISGLIARERVMRFAKSTPQTRRRKAFWRGSTPKLAGARRFHGSRRASK